MNPRSKEDQVLTCEICGCIFKLTHAEFKGRIKSSKRGKLYCSLKCFGLSLKVPAQVTSTKILYSKDLSVEENTAWIEHKTCESKWMGILIDIKKVIGE